MSTEPRFTEPLRRTSLAQRVADSLRSAILDGRLAAGATLRQSALAREFGVSVIPLREALCQLEGEGLVHHAPHRGVIVADMNAEDVEELILIYSALEELALRRSVPQLSDADLAEAAAALRALRDEQDLTAFAELAWRLRLALLRRSNSPRLLQMLEALERGNRRYYALFFHDAAARKWMCTQWTGLVKLARKRDVDGLLAHLAAAQRRGSAIARRLLPQTTGAEAQP